MSCLPGLAVQLVGKCKIRKFDRSFSSEHWLRGERLDQSVHTEQKSENVAFFTLNHINNHNIGATLTILFFHQNVAILHPWVKSKMLEVRWKEERCVVRAGRGRTPLSDTPARTFCNTISEIINIHF